jgi:serine phosphatase RsbU (regulator of sigma subunit)
MSSPVVSTQDFEQTQDRIRKFDLGKWLIYLTFAIAFLVFLDAPILALDWRTKPFPGFVVEQTLVISDVEGKDWSAKKVGLDHPQQITSLAEIALHSPEDFRTTINTLAIGQSIEVKTLSLDGVEHVFPSIPITSFSTYDLARMFWLPYGIGLAYLLIGLWVFAMRGHTPPGRAFAMFCASTAITTGLYFDLVTTHAGSAIWTLALSLIGGSLVSLALVFPAEWSPVKKRSRLRFLPYVLSLGIGMWGLFLLNNFSNPWAYFSGWRASYTYIALAILFFLGMTLYRQYTTTSAIARQQARIVLWGSLLAFVPIAVWMLAPLFKITVSWEPVLFLPLLLFFPLSVGVAILRYRLWDLDVIVNRTLVYTILTVLLGTVFIGLVMGLQAIFRTMTGPVSEPALVLATVVIVLLFNPLRQWVQDFIDRRFYRRKYDLAHTLEAFSQSLRDQVDLHRLIERLETVICEAIMPSQVQTWLFSSTGYSLGDIGDNPGDAGSRSLRDAIEISLQDPLVPFLDHLPGAEELEELEIESPGLLQMRTAGIQLVVPLVTHGELIGWLGLGPRRSGQDYSVDDRALLTNLATQAAPAVRVAQLVAQQQAELLERDRINQEMQVASRIQHALLPKELPNIKGWRMAAYYQPARAVGGDFYDFLQFKDGCVGIFIGDVTGKGIPAAMVMALTRTLLRAIAMEGASPAQVLTRVNELLKPDMPSNMFVTCLYVILDPQTGIMRYANAGHPVPYRRTKQGIAELRASGFPLGLLSGIGYAEEETYLETGECLIFFSDGLVEAHNARREMFGFPRLQKLLADRMDDGEMLIDRLLDELKAFTGDQMEQEDDITLVGIKHLGE